MTHGILSDRAIVAAITQGDIEIDPFDRKQLNPASYDLTLGDEVAVYNRWVHLAEERAHPGSNGLYLRRAVNDLESQIGDVKVEQTVVRTKIGDAGYILLPGIGYLLHTCEVVHVKKHVGAIDGKSSLGRLFVQVHATAGYVDPGWLGQLTLEATVTHPIRLYPGMRIAQIRFHTMVGEPLHPYDGQYKGDTARGPVASRAWRMFK
jgi:dCTP deaminase